MKLSEIEKDIESDLIKVIHVLNDSSIKIKPIVTINNNNTKNCNEDLTKLNIKDLTSIIYNKVSSLKEFVNNIQSSVFNDTNEESLKSEMEKYEQLLIKSEQDIRSHIKTEFQLKIYIESLEVKIDSLERENIQMKNLISYKEKEISEESKAQNEVSINIYIIEENNITYFSNK